MVLSEPDDPAQFNKAVINKLREDLNSKPLIANKLSQSKDAREFLQQGSQQTDTKQPAQQAATPPKAPAAVSPSEASGEGISPEVFADNTGEVSSEEGAGSLSGESSGEEGPEGVSSQKEAKETEEAAKKAPERAKVSYTTKKGIVFYRKECQLQSHCIKIPVLTNLNSIIFEYNQGRYSAQSVNMSPSQQPNR